MSINFDDNQSYICNQQNPWRQNHKIHHRVHKTPPPDPILSQFNLLYTPPPNLPKIRFCPILPSTPRSSEWSLSFGLSHQNLLHFPLLSHACHMPSHLILLDLICLMISGYGYKLWSSPLPHIYQYENFNASVILWHQNLKKETRNERSSEKKIDYGIEKNERKRKVFSILTVVTIFYYTDHKRLVIVIT
jgi:hypothetical protein